MVEDLSVRSIAAARQAYENTGLRSKLSRFHDDVDSAFRGWNDIWLDPEFRSWNIEEYLPRIATRRTPSCWRHAPSYRAFDRIRPPFSCRLASPGGGATLIYVRKPPNRGSRSRLGRVACRDRG